MASTVYPLTKQAFLEDAVGVNLDTADVRAIVVDTADYTYSAAHNFLDDVPGAARVATTGTLQNTTTTNGVFDADDITITGVTGDQSEAIVVYVHDGGADSARRLLCYIDSGTGIPVTPSGGDLIISWNASGIFSL